jgi:peptide subunit release factor 1 (eRF1)
MLTEQDVQRAVEFESYDAPVLSVYLNVDPRRRTGESHKVTLRNLLAGVEGADPEDVKRVQNYIEMGYNRQGLSVILFSCAKKDFWWAFSFSVPVEDFAFVSFRPYVRQLARMLDIYERCGVVHVDQEGARLYLFNMGVLENAEGYMGEEVKLHRGGGWANPRIQRHETGQARQNLQEAAELAEDFYRKSGTRRLILAGTDKNVAQFKDLLSNRLRSIIIGQISADANASPSDLRDPALELAAKEEAREANVIAERVISTAWQGGNAVLGLEETLTAVQQGRAAHVVTLADYVQPAYRFVDSGHILLDLHEEADLQSGRVQNLPDAVESCLRRALAQNIGVTVVAEHEGLEKAGKIGALTRY